MKYYKIPQSEIEGLLPKMKESFGHENITVRMSIDGSQGLTQFTDKLAPLGYIGHDNETISVIINTSEWNPELEPM